MTSVYFVCFRWRHVCNTQYVQRKKVWQNHYHSFFSMLHRDITMYIDEIERQTRVEVITHKQTSSYSQLDGETF